MIIPIEQEMQIVISNEASPGEKCLRSILNDEGELLSEPMMQKVPQILRDKFDSKEKLYYPVIVSIGPYHHGDGNLKRGDKFKIPLARQYVDSILKKKKDVADILKTKDELYQKIQKVTAEARKCYYEKSEPKDQLDGEAFTKMIFLDGCFILQFIECIANKKNINEMNMKSRDIAFVQRDLFLLENQLPFKVLEELMSMKGSNKEEWLITIKKFIKERWAHPPAKSTFVMLRGKFWECILRHLCRIPQPKKKGLPDREGEGEDEDEDVHLHLLGLLWSQVINKDLGKNEKNGKNESDWYSYRSVQDLVAAGIHFKHSKSNCFTDVQFEPRLISPVLRLPPMTIDHSSKSLLLNLVAYEACHNGPDFSGVASYICFMDTLIDHHEDVKELRRRGILLNCLGSDEDVAALFNEISNDLVPNPDVYSLVKAKIESHHRNRIRVWMAEWLHTHFHSPWTILAFLGALLVLALSLIQTYLARFPPDNDKSSQNNSTPTKPWAFNY